MDLHYVQLVRWPRATLDPLTARYCIRMARILYFRLRESMESDARHVRLMLVSTVTVAFAPLASLNSHF
jgi:hypothetical protein